MKKRLAAVLALLSIVSLTACGNSEKSESVGVEESTTAATESTAPAETEPALKVPDIIGVDESSAKNVLSAMGIIPAVEYGYTNDVETGCVYNTSPAVGAGINMGEKVKIYVSEGAESLEAKNGIIGWDLIEGSDGSDWWSFYAPTIEKGNLIVNFTDVTFGADMSWYDGSDSSGHSFGCASLSSSFDKTVPIVLYYETKDNAKGTPQNFTVEVPLSSLGEEKPTNLYLYACYLDSNGLQKNVYFDLTLEW